MPGQLTAPRRGGALLSRRAARWLPLISMLAAVLMVIAAVNLVLVFVLASTYQPVGWPATDFINYLPYLAIGVLPFLVTAGLIARTVVGSRTATDAGQERPQIAGPLLRISGVGLPLMVVCGFGVGFAAAALVQPSHLPGADVLYVYQFTFVAAVVADAVTLVVALVSRTNS